MLYNKKYRKVASNFKYKVVRYWKANNGKKMRTTKYFETERKAWEFARNPSHETNVVFIKRGSTWKGKMSFSHKHIK